MANTLTGLTPTLYRAVSDVSREMVGFIPAVTLDAAASQAALNQPVTRAKTRVSAASDVTPSVTPPDLGDQTLDAASITITRSRSVWVRWNGEQQLVVANGVGYDALLKDQFTEAMRTLVNEIEADMAALYVKASRAYGTAGTTPFASDLSDPAQVRKILVDNGAPTTDLQLVLDTTAGAKVRSLAQLTKANEAGTTSLREQGQLLNIHGFSLRESAQVKSVTKGSGASYLANNSSGYDIADTSIAVDSGSGTVLAGDVVTFAGDTNKYVVGSALSAGVLSLNSPGLRKALADNAAMTVGNSYTANMAFARQAIRLATRVPATPKEGDAAKDFMMITDPVSGLTFGVWMYAQYKQIAFEIGLAWGQSLDKPEHCALLLG